MLQKSPIAKRITPLERNKVRSLWAVAQTGESKLENDTNNRNENDVQEKRVLKIKGCWWQQWYLW